MFINPNPECADKDCQFTQSLIKCDDNFEPSYDKHGKNKNPERRGHSYTLTCNKCNTSWHVKTNGVDTEITKV